MNISLFGATGKTGSEILKQSLEKGVTVNALVRDPSKLNSSDAKLKIFKGDALDNGSFADVQSGTEVSLIALSGVMEQGIKNILEDAKNHGVKKIILMSSYPMSGSIEGMNYLKSAGMDDAKIGEMMPMINDKIAQESLLKNSGLTWVIVRPTFLRDEAKTGNYQIVKDIVEFNAAVNQINRSDVADFMLKASESSEWDNQVVSISS